MSKIGTTWFPLFKGGSVEKNFEIVIDGVNQFVTDNNLRVINIETVHETDWLGRPTEVRGVRVWWQS
jgi:hypothetical protein